MKIKNHILDEVKYLKSSNYNERPDEKDISLIVIHSISLPPTIFGNTYVEDFFLNKLPHTNNDYLNSIRSMKVSPHLYIKRDGEVIQFVPFNKRAWHAGKSFYNGRENCNDFSIGIELEGCEDISFEDNQYIKLSEILHILFKEYPSLNIERTVAHSDISPGRKLDPGPLFDWKRLKSMIK